MALVGVLGGMIGLGGAEFRLPLLIGLFGFVALQAVVLNEAMSLLVVLTALPARLFSVPWSSCPPLVRSGQPARRQPGRCLGGGDLGDADEVGHVVPGARGAAGPGRRRAGVEPFRSCRGAGSTAGRATCRRGGHWDCGRPDGCGRGRAAYPDDRAAVRVDIEIAGSLSLAVSLPTMLVAFARYSRDASFAVLRQQRAFVLAMAAGSIAGTALEDSSSASCPISS